MNKLFEMSNMQYALILLSITASVLVLSAIAVRIIYQVEIKKHNK